MRYTIPVILCALLIWTAIQEYRLHSIQALRDQDVQIEEVRSSIMGLKDLMRDSHTQMWLAIADVLPEAHPTWDTLSIGSATDLQSSTHSRTYAYQLPATATAAQLRRALDKFRYRMAILWGLNDRNAYPHTIKAGASILTIAIPNPDPDEKVIYLQVEFRFSPYVHSQPRPN